LIFLRLFVMKRDGQTDGRARHVMRFLGRPRYSRVLLTLTTDCAYSASVFAVVVDQDCKDKEVICMLGRVLTDVFWDMQRRLC